MNRPPPTMLTMTPGKPRTVCYLLAYREPGYIRTRTLLQALESLPGYVTFTAINQSRGLFRYLEMAIKLLKVRWRHHPEIYILGFRGHESYWPTRLLTLGSTLVLDAMMSPYGALKEEGKHGLVGRILASVVYYLEKSALHNAHRVLTDTVSHQTWMADTFSLPKHKIVCLPVGADESLRIPSLEEASGPLKILFYGTFLPLHGVPVIVEAARLLRNQPVLFTLIGGRESDRKWMAKGVSQANGRLIHLGWVPFEQLLGEYIPKAHVCLGGPFGDTPQARRVVTGKTQQFMAMGKATVVANNHGEWGFDHQVNALLVPANDPEELARTLLWAMEHRRELPSLGQHGRQLYQKRFSVARIRETLSEVLALC